MPEYWFLLCDSINLLYADLAVTVPKIGIDTTGKVVNLQTCQFDTETVPCWNERITLLHNITVTVRNGKCVQNVMWYLKADF